MPIPFNDIKIDPKKLKSKLLNKIEKIDVEDIIKKNIIKEIKDILDANHFWYEITGKNICAYRYQFSKKKEGHICGKPIYRDKEIEYGDFLCSRHHKGHKVERHRKLKENETQCIAIGTNSKQCEYSAKIDKYCTTHYKIINNIKDIKNVHDIIEEIHILNNIEYILEKDNNHNLCTQIIKENRQEKELITNSLEIKENINNIYKYINKKRKDNDNYDFIINKKIKLNKDIKNAKNNNIIDNNSIININQYNIFKNILNNLNNNNKNKKEFNIIFKENNIYSATNINKQQLQQPDPLHTLKNKNNILIKKD